MRWQPIRRAGLVTAGLILLFTGSVHAQSETHRGLSISPVRDFVTVSAGQQRSRTVTVGNQTAAPMEVAFSIHRFSVADLSYDFNFYDEKDSWISPATPRVSLAPGQTRSLSYLIDVPAGSAPGGRYYGIFVTANGQAGDDRQQVQAASLLYLTVAGSLSHGSGLPASSISHLVFGSRVPYSLDITNSGNDHYFVFLTAELYGLFNIRRSSAESHLLLPGTTRHIASSLPAPFWPGLYTVRYGYKSDYSPSVSRISRVIYLPLWSLAGLLLAAGAVSVGIRRRLKKN